MKINFYFKIFNNIKSEHEVNILAYLELKSLFGEIKPINNFVDYIIEEPLKSFTKDPIRFQDIITMELPYGKIHGYFGQKNELYNITNLIQRLTYTREFYVLVENNNDPIEILNQIFPNHSLNINTQFFQLNNKLLFRFITNQFFIEKSEYISITKKTKNEINKDINLLFSYLTNNYYRIPSPSTSKHYRTLLDNLAVREETSLYLNHYMHPYKGKSHPKMVRALINYILPDSSGVILDNFAGSGTTLVESSFLGLNSLGVEINPLSVLMSKVKCQSYKIPIDNLRSTIDHFMLLLKEKSKLLDSNQSHLEVLTTSSGNLESKLKLPYKELTRLGIGKKSVQKIILARDLLQSVDNKNIKDFLLLSLSGAISDIVRRTSNEFTFVLQDRINDLFNRLYLFNELNKNLKLVLGNSDTICADTKDMSFIKSNSIDGIINSPPYLTALDYIDNDYPQLILLNLVFSWDKLDENMIGNPNYSIISDELHVMIKSKIKNYEMIYNLVQEISEPFEKINRNYAVIRITKFILDMTLSISEMYRVLKKGSKCAIIIGNNHFKIENYFHEIPNDEIITKIANEIGFTEDLFIERDVHKSSLGLIQKEKILIFQK